MLVEVVAHRRVVRLEAGRGVVRELRPICHSAGCRILLANDCSSSFAADLWGGGGWGWAATYDIRDYRGEEMPDTKERKSLANEIKPRKLVIIHDSLSSGKMVKEGGVPGLEVKAINGSWQPSTQKLRSELERFRKMK